MGWMHCQSTTRFIITKLSIDSPLNWQHHLHSLSIDNRNHDVCVVNVIACNRYQSITNKMITDLSIDILLNWKREWDTVSIDKQKKKMVFCFSIDTVSIILMSIDNARSEISFVNWLSSRWTTKRNQVNRQCSFSWTGRQLTILQLKFLTDTHRYALGFWLSDHPAITFNDDGSR